jgi:hypothetical protein
VTPLCIYHCIPGLPAFDAALAREGAAAAETLAARLAAPAADIAPAIPPEVALGYHGCFGTLSGWPSRQPTGCRAARCAYVSGECIGVLMVPGATAFTRMPRFAYSIASDLVAAFRQEFEDLLEAWLTNTLVTQFGVRPSWTARAYVGLRHPNYSPL